MEAEGKEAGSSTETNLYISIKKSLAEKKLTTMVQSHQDLVTPEIQAQFKKSDEIVMYAERTQKLRAVGQAKSGQDEDRIYV